MFQLKDYSDISKSGGVKDLQKSAPPEQQWKNWQIFSKSDFSEHWKLIKGLQQPGVEGGSTKSYEEKK